MHVYKYIGDEPRDFPTLGKRDVKKGDEIQSESPLENPFLKEVKPKKADSKETPKTDTKGSEK